MRVLIDQQFHLGHHYQYVAYLLPSLTEMAEVVVAITPEGQESKEFRAFLEPLASRIRFEPVLPSAKPWLPMSERWRVHRDLRTVVRKFRPDYVWIPSGDAQATMMALHRLAGIGGTPGRVPCEIGIHLGSGAPSAAWRTRLRDSLNGLNLSLAGARCVHLVNFLFYERVRRIRPRAFSVMPHPVAAGPQIDKAESRRLLAIPEDGRYIGLAASIDSRKAVGEFLAGFREVARPGERVLLAGYINDTHWKTINESFADLIAREQLWLIRRFLTAAEYQAALCALDVVCTPYPRFAGLSSTLLEGVAAGRPILADNFGWSAEVVHRFGLGTTCDVLDHAQFARAIRAALDAAGAYRRTEGAERLLAFHTVQNFSDHWMAGIDRALGRPARPSKTWDWVNAVGVHR
jgi:glycosyltransferase involved in cell wall biosynthesis